VIISRTTVYRNDGKSAFIRNFIYQQTGSRIVKKRNVMNKKRRNMKLSHALALAIWATMKKNAKKLLVHALYIKQCNLSLSHPIRLSRSASAAERKEMLSVFYCRLSFAQQLGGFIDEGMQAISPALFYCRPIQQRRLAVRFVLTPQLASSESLLLWLLRPSRSFSATELLT